MGLLIAGIIAAAIGATVGIASTITTGVQSKKQREAAEKSRKKLEQQFEIIKQNLDNYNLNEEERLEVLRTLNGEMDENAAARMKDYTDSMQSIMDTFKVDSDAAMDLYWEVTNNVLSSTYQNSADAIKAFSDGMVDNIMAYQYGSPAVYDEAGNLIQEARPGVIDQINLTEAQLQIIRDNYSATMAANTANYVNQSAGITEQMRAEMAQIIGEYEAGANGRNLQLKNALADSTDEFKNLVRGEAVLRDKVVGDWLKQTGEVLAAVNEGTAQILGVTPEENLQKAEAAAADFATSYLSQTGQQAGQLAQQQARMAGLTPGQAALLQTAAVGQAFNGNWQTATELGLGQFRQAEAALTQAQKEQFDRQTELADMQISAAQEAERRNSEMAQRVAELEQENAQIVAEQQQEDQQTLLDAREQAAREAAQQEQARILEEARQKEEAATKTADDARQDQKDLLDATMSANKEIKDTEQERLEQVKNDTIANEAANRDATLEQQQSGLAAEQQKARDQADRETAAAQDAYDKSKQEDQDKYNRQIYEQETERAKDLTNIDVNERQADRLAGVTQHQNELAAQAQKNAAEALSNLSDNAIGAGTELAETAAATQ